MLSDQRILIIDDQPLVRKVIKTMLAGKNCQGFFEAANGVEAKRVMAEASPTLVICDVNMAPGDGFAFLEDLRKGTFGDAGIPVIFLTSDIDPAMIERATAMGVDGYLLKPVTPDDLSAEIEKVLKNHWQKIIRQQPDGDGVLSE